LGGLEARGRFRSDVPAPGAQPCREVAAAKHRAQEHAGSSPDVRALTLHAVPPGHLEQRSGVCLATSSTSTTAKS
jgi:hypothetical protein